MSLWKQGSVLLGVVCHRQKMEQLGILGERTKVVATEGGAGLGHGSQLTCKSNWEPADL